MAQVKGTTTKTRVNPTPRKTMKKNSSGIVVQPKTSGSKKISSSKTTYTK